MRCALGCEPNGAALHRFPNPVRLPKQYKAWVQVMGGDPRDTWMYKHKRICNVHFIKKHQNRNSRISISAVPLLHLPKWCKEPKNQTLKRHKPELDISTTRSNMTLVSPDEKTEIPDATSPENEHDYCIKAKLPEEDTDSGDQYILIVSDEKKKRKTVRDSYRIEFKKKISNDPDSKYNEPMSFIEKGTSEYVDIIDWNSEKDSVEEIENCEDFNFLMSLLPRLLDMSVEQRARVRNKINEIIQEEMTDHVTGEDISKSC